MEDANDRNRQPGWDGGETLEETTAILRDHAAPAQAHVSSAVDHIEESRQVLAEAEARMVGDAGDAGDGADGA